MSERADSLRPNPRLTFWLILLAMVLMATNMRSPIVALGSIAPVLQEVLSLSPAEIGWLGALPLPMFALGALLSPWLGRRFGLIGMLMGAMVLLAVGMLVRVLWANWAVFFVGTALLSFAIGIANTLATPAIKELTPQHIPLATGVVGISMMLVAGAVAGLVLPISERFGWQWALGGWTGLTLLAVLVWWQVQRCLRSPLADTQLMSLPPAQTPSTQPPSIQTTSTQTPSTQLPPLKIWRQAYAWQLAIFMGMQSLLFYTVASFLPSIWIAKGLPAVSAGNMATIYQLMAPIATLVLMVLMNQSRFVRPLALGSAFANLLGMVGMAHLTVELAWLWSACIGLGGAMLFTLCMMLIGLRTYTSEQASDLSGMAQTIGYSIAFFGPLGAGWLYQSVGTWQVTLNILLGLMVMNVGFAWLVSRPQMVDGGRV